MAGRQDRPYRLVLTRTAARALRQRLPEAVAAAVAGFLVGDLVREPRRVGKPLQREILGVWSARRGAYRVLYEVDDVDGIVRVVDIDHRRVVYRRR